jgi:hypothetical protein
MPSDYPTPEQLAQQNELFKRINAAGYAGIPKQGEGFKAELGPGAPGSNPMPPPVNADPTAPVLPPYREMPPQEQQMAQNPAQAQDRSMQQLAQGPQASGYKSQKVPSAIPLHFVLGNDDSNSNVGVTPMASGNKFRSISGELGMPVGPGDLSLKGGAGRVMGHYKSPLEYDLSARYEAKFAMGGAVDGQSLVEQIGPNTQQQINTAMSQGGLANFAKGGSVGALNGLSQLRSEFEKRGLDFDKFLYGKDDHGKQ